MSNKIRSIAKARERQQAKSGEITVSLGRLIHCGMQTEQNPFPSLFVLVGQELPIRQSFLLGKLTKSVSAEIEQYQASRKTLCEKYSEKDGEGKARMIDAEGKPVAEGQPGNYDIPKERMDDFSKEHQELIDTEVSIPGVKIKINDLAGVKISPAHVMALEWLICEG